MRLVIFDIDGTLTQTMKAEEECFVRSLAEVCGFRGVDTDWSRYKHATDSGIFHEIHEVRTGRPPSPIEISRFREHFVEMLAQVASDAPFAAVEGAPLLLSRLSEEGAVCVFSDLRDADLFLRSVYEISNVPNHALQRTAAGRRGCNHRAPWPPSLSLGR
jgi:phosphoglycolate phosphatase-like HAD superfamily hydrolase